MVSKMKVLLTGLFVLGLMAFGAQTAQAQALTPEIQAEITTLIADAVAENDATILEDGIFALAGDNTELAAAIAGFAADNLPADSGTPAEGDVTQSGLAEAVARGAVLAAPESATEIETSMSAFSDVIAAAIEEALAEADLETAAGGAGPGPATPGGPGLGAGAENPSQNSASPAG